MGFAPLSIDSLYLRCIALKRYLPLFFSLLLLAGLGCEPGAPIGSYEEGAELGEAATATQAVSCEGLKPELCEELQDPDLDPEIQALIESSRDIPIPETTLDKLDQALFADQIDGLSYRKYRLFAYLRPEKVPEEFRAAEVPYGDVVVRTEMQWFIDNFHTLTEEQKADIVEFVVPPEDERSYFNPNNHDIDESFFLEEPLGEPAVDESSLTSGILGMRSAYAFYLKKNIPKEFYEGATTSVYVSGAEKVIIHQYLIREKARYDDDFKKAWREAMKKNVLWVKEAVEKSWPQFKDLLGVEPAETVQLHLFHTGKGIMGIQRHVEGHCLVFINWKSRWKLQIQSATAHELFHCFQDALLSPDFAKTTMAMTEKEQQQCKDQNWCDRKWLKEATARWSEHFIYEKYNMEWSRLSQYFRNLNVDRLKFGGDHEYASYLFFLFLVQHGNSALIVTDLLTASGLMGSPRDAIMAHVPNFNDIYPTFAEYNFNSETFALYRDQPYFPEIHKVCNPTFSWKKLFQKKKIQEMYCMPSGPHSKDLMIENEPRTHFVTKALKEGGNFYNLHLIKEKKIKKVIFRFSELLEGTEEHLGRQLAVRNEDKVWQLFDAREELTKLFCRDRIGENIDRAVVIFSNAKLTKLPKDVEGYPVDYEIETSETPCEVRSYTKLNMQLQGNTGAHWTAELNQNDTVEYSVDRDEYVLTARQMTFLQNGLDDCGLLIKGEGQLSETYTLEEGPMKFKFLPEIPSAEDLEGLKDLAGAGTFIDQIDQLKDNIKDIKGTFGFYPSPLDPDDQKWVAHTSARPHVAVCKDRQLKTSQGVPILLCGDLWKDHPILTSQDVQEDRIRGIRYDSFEDPEDGSSWSCNITFEYKK